jgi:AcrR family transcriptional regulator
MATARMTRAESKAATRTELLDAARRVFVERGYHGASLDLVAREAGYTKGAVYSAFGGKAQMFFAVFEREVERRWSRLERESAEAGEPSIVNVRSWFERLRVERAWSVTVLEFRLHAARDPELNARYAEHHSRVVDRLARILERHGGVAREDARPAAVDLIALANGYALEHLALPEEATEDRFADASTAMSERFRR